MTRKTLWGGLLVGALGLGLGCGRQAALDSTQLNGRGGDDDLRPLSGAIWTTDTTGARVDQNLYAEFCDVYLNGGPMKEGAAGLPEGDYYFQVTSPSEGVPSELLSTDEVAERKFHVGANGEIEAYLGATHDSHPADSGDVLVQLCPFNDTPNPGCVFKVWVTPVEKYDLEAKNATFGFQSNWSKTDNFKVCSEITPPPPGGGGECDTDDDGNEVCTPESSGG